MITCTGVATVENCLQIGPVWHDRVIEAAIGQAIVAVLPIVTGKLNVAIGTYLDVRERTVVQGIRERQLNVGGAIVAVVAGVIHAGNDSALRLGVSVGHARVRSGGYGCDDNGRDHVVANACVAQIRIVGRKCI